MGTRADFYIGRGESAEWLGSVSYEGRPENYPHILKATSEQEFRDAVSQLTERGDAYFPPEDKWPWSWNDSRQTDYTISWDEGRLWIAKFGRGWITKDAYLFSELIAWRTFKTQTFPDMFEDDEDDYMKTPVSWKITF